MPDLDLSVRAQLDTKETVRRIASASFEVRDKGSGRLELEGYASTTEKPYDMADMYGDYTEVISRGAFGKTLAEGADVALLLNHGGLTMARTRSGSLKLSEDDTGLHWLGQVNSTRSDVKDMLAAIADGDVDECSFAFRVVKQQWSPNYDERRITEVNLNRGDVCPVNFGANPNTSIGRASAVGEKDVRSFIREASKRLSADELRALLASVMEDVATVSIALDPDIDGQTLSAGYSLEYARLL